VEATIWVGVNGSSLPRGKNVEVRAGDSIEVDFHFTNGMGNSGKFMGVGMQVVVPAAPLWKVSNGTFNYPKGWSPEGSGPTLWNARWDRGGNGDSGGIIQWVASQDVPGSYHLTFSDPAFAVSPEVVHGAVQADRGKDDPSDRDGVANHAGADMSISVPTGVAPGDYSVKIFGIGHDRKDRLAKVEYALTVTVVSGKMDNLANLPQGVTGTMIYARSCATCHGGTPNVPTLEKVRTKSVDELRGSVLRGKGNMPALGASAGGKLSETEITAALEFLVRTASKDPKKTGPMLQHGLVGKEGRCTECHQTGGVAIPPPSNHPGYDSKACLVCHPTPPKMPHPADGRAACGACHKVPDTESKSGVR
jgi:cytochrome c5